MDTGLGRGPCTTAEQTYSDYSRSPLSTRNLKSQCLETGAAIAPIAQTTNLFVENYVFDCKENIRRGFLLFSNPAHHVSHRGLDRLGWHKKFVLDAGRTVYH